jgi:hypothetical protein
VIETIAAALAEASDHAEMQFMQRCSPVVVGIGRSNPQLEEKTLNATN